MSKMNKTRKFLDEFKTFSTKGSVVDMVVAFVFGGAFGSVVSSIVSDIIMPPIGVLIGGVTFTDLKFMLKGPSVDPLSGRALSAVYINYGQFLQTTLEFAIIAFSVFLIVKFMSGVKTKEDIIQEEETRLEQLLTEIRDLLLKEKNNP